MITTRELRDICKARGFKRYSEAAKKKSTLLEFVLVRIEGECCPLPIEEPIPYPGGEDPADYPTEEELEVLIPTDPRPLMPTFTLAFYVIAYVVLGIATIAVSLPLWAGKLFAIQWTWEKVATVPLLAAYGTLWVLVSLPLWTHAITTRIVAGNHI